ncbi:MAG: DUF4340 domain-containing protein [Opitutaceae bacterium]|nr:DUF4340 domain-containing protein [Opitutaceae bacterium]
MKLKTLAFVVALLAALSAAVFFVNRPGSPSATDARVGQPLAAAGTFEKATKLRFSDQGKIVILAKPADGPWQVTSYYDLPADLSKLTRLVSDLTEAKIQRLVTSSPDRIARLELKDLQVAVFGAAHQELWSVTLGKYADSGGRFVRFGTEQKAYLASLSTTLDTDAKSWADSQLVSVKADDIAKVEFSSPDKPSAVVIAERPKKAEPFAVKKLPEGMKLKADSVGNLLNSFSSLRFSNTYERNDPQAAAANAHMRMLKLTTFDNQTVTFAIGQKPAEKIIKSPVVPADAAKRGPAAAISLPAAGEKDASKTPEGAVKDGPAKTLEAVTETIPAGPVFVSITHSDSKAPVNALMQKRAVTIEEYLINNLPQKSDDLFEPLPPSPLPAAVPTPIKADDQPPAVGSPEPHKP